MKNTKIAFMIFDEDRVTAVKTQTHPHLGKHLYGSRIARLWELRRRLGYERNERDIDKRAY
jgi:hypothetical protein